MTAKKKVRVPKIFYMWCEEDGGIPVPGFETIPEALNDAEGEGFDANCTGMYEIRRIGKVVKNGATLVPDTE